MRKLQEFEMFKRLMLDKHQEKLFSSLPKPNLTNLDFSTLKSENSSSKAQSSGRKTMFSLQSLPSEENDSLEDEDLLHEIEVQNAYEDLKKRGQVDEVTKKLLKAFEDSVLRAGQRSKTMRKTGLKKNDFDGFRKSEDVFGMIKEEDEEEKDIDVKKKK